MTNLIAPTHLDALRTAVHGTVSGPGDPDYDVARAAWNLAIDQRPAAVVRAAGIDDLCATVRIAAAHGLRVAPQATGHGAGALGPVDDAILLRTDGLRRVTVDPVARTARIEAGAQWNDVLAQSAPHALAPLAGSAGDVGVVGFHLGGGLSFLSRKHGLAARHLLAATVVLADGSVVRVDATDDSDDSDLLWALRGGSGAFGVVAEIEIALHPAPELSTGQLFWPIERSREVYGAWRDWAATAPEAITTSARMLRFPPDPAIPEPIRGGAFLVIDGAFLGSSMDCDAALAPLRALEPAMDLFGPTPITALTQLHMDPPAPAPFVSGHTLVREATDELLDRLVELAGPGAQTDLMLVELRQLGGAIGRGGDGVGAVDGLDAGFALFTGAVPMGQPMASLEAQIAAIIDAAADQAAGTFPNFVEHPGADAPLAPATTERLQALRAEVDPAGLLLAAHAPA